MPDPESTLQQIKRSLDLLSEEVTQGKYPGMILKDLKLSVDHLRLTLWAIIEFEDQSKKAAQGAKYGLTTKLFEFRIKRLTQMLNDLRADLSRTDIGPTAADLRNLAAALHTTLQKINPPTSTSA